jgi:hypothetical protein
MSIYQNHSTLKYVLKFGKGCFPVYLLPLILSTRGWNRFCQEAGGGMEGGSPNKIYTCIKKRF